MNLKNPRTRYLIVGVAVLLLVGFGVFCFLHFSAEPVITGDLPREEWPKVQVAVRHARLQRVMGALRNWRWQKLPNLLADCVGRPIVRSESFSSDCILVEARDKKGRSAICYFLVRRGNNWVVVSEMWQGPSNSPPIFSPSNANQGKQNVYE